jgi:hypothetical protein
MSITRVHVDVEVTNEDESDGVDDTHSINSDATLRTSTPMPVEDSYSIVHSGAVQVSLCPLQYYKLLVSRRQGGPTYSAALDLEGGSQLI